jgi:hypothetical protein
VGAGVNGASVPASSKVPIITLEQGVADTAVDGLSGLLTQNDYFDPFDHGNMKGGDKDVRPSGVTLLDPGSFSGRRRESHCHKAPGRTLSPYLLEAPVCSYAAQG